MKKGAVFNDAFLVCHEIYVAARELVNSRVPTTQLQSASKFLWRPDLRPRLVEYVADFARAGERALGEREKTRTLKNDPSQLSARGCGTRAGETSFCAGSSPYRGRSRARQHQTLPGLRDRFAAPDNTRHAGQRGSRQFPRASRLILFRMYYLGGAEYEAARHVLGLSERTWSDWAEENRQRVSAELIRAHIYPPARYFRQAATPAATPPASTNDASEAKMAAVPCEPDFV
jgi:hypothetical protein